MTITIRLGDWDALKDLAYPVRKAVFVIEQSVPEELEWDDMDRHSIHAVALSADGSAIGTGRLLPDGRIGRMAVLSGARGRKVGALLLTSLMQCARQRGDRRLVLSAQEQAAGFYERYGFERTGEEFVEAGIRHIEMAHMLP